MTWTWNGEEKTCLPDKIPVLLELFPVERKNLVLGLNKLSQCNDEYEYDNDNDDDDNDDDMTDTGRARAVF